MDITLDVDMNIMGDEVPQLQILELRHGEGRSRSGRATSTGSPDEAKQGWTSWDSGNRRERRSKHDDDRPCLRRAALPPLTLLWGEGYGF